MGKKENHKEDLVNLFNDYFQCNKDERIIDYIIINSNLPGRRGNLELAEAFGDVAEENCTKKSKELWKLCKEMSQISAVEAPINDPKELITFCGIIGIGAISSKNELLFPEGASILRESSKDGRWRMREAVAMSIQRLLTHCPEKILQELELWILDKDNLVSRAVVAGLADPPILKNKNIAKGALDIHKKIINNIIKMKSEERKCEDYKVLKKGLGYTLSVVVAETPKEGFEYMNELIKVGDKDITWIVMNNLKKSRLLKQYPNEVAKINQLL